MKNVKRKLKSRFKKKKKKKVQILQIHFWGRLTLAKDILTQSRCSTKNLDYLPISLRISAVTLSEMDWAVSGPFLFFIHLSIEGQSTLLWKVSEFGNLTLHEGSAQYSYNNEGKWFFCLPSISKVPVAFLIHILGEFRIF